VPAEIRIFREPHDLKAALDAASPDLLGLSNYAWNAELSHQFARYARGRSPKTLICMGGPNFPLTANIQETFLLELAEIDAYVNGPTYESEVAFLNLVRRFVDVNLNREGIYEEPIPGISWIHPRDGAFQPASPIKRIRDLDDIPSPYLAGLMDPYFATGYFPLLQIARGCPFSCAFCNSAALDNNKIYAHSVENVKSDLLYIAERVRSEVTLCFADDNFGMYSRDVEIADYIAWLQDHYNWPRYVRTTTGKNRGERIIQVMRKTRGALPMTSAVQSLNPVVLKNIKRDNIRLETYHQLQEELLKQGMQSYGELIICLPGETKQSFLDAVEELIDAGSKRISAHQLMLLHGAELANPDARERYKLDTRFRVVARNLGNYIGEPVVEVEEMVVATPDISFDDYIEIRVFHLLLTIFYYEGNFDEPIEYARMAGIKPFNLVRHMQAMLHRASADFRKVIDDFVRESREELFMTRGECLDWSRRHYDQLVSGELGGNLLSKYSMIGRFYATHAALDFIKMAIESALVATGIIVRGEELAAIMDYMSHVMLHAPFAETMSAGVRFALAYDVEAWARDKYERRLADYRFNQPVYFDGLTSAERKALIAVKIETFGEHPSGLGKFTRTMFARDLRRTLFPVTSSVDLKAAS
jgi:radical SAM superfamily enzyme YgiQ (UPF0313 family)